MYPHYCATSLSDIDARLAEIDENLVRHELNALEHSEQTLRRKELYEAKHPATKKGGDKQSAEAKKLSADSALSFVKDTATKTNQSPRTVSQDVQIAKNIPKEVREQIRDTPLAGKKTPHVEGGDLRRCVTGRLLTYH